MGNRTVAGMDMEVAKTAVRLRFLYKPNRPTEYSIITRIIFSIKATQLDGNVGCMACQAFFVALAQ
jgi:hypothetical protein